MSFPFSALVTASGAITFTCRDGSSHTINRENARYAEAKELLNQIVLMSDEDAQTDLIDDLVKIATPAKSISSDTGNRVFVRDGKVYYRDLDDSSESEIHNVVGERIVWMINEGFDTKPMLAFLEHLMANPSYRSVNDLYRFMERNQMGITPDGFLLTYKRIRSNYMDIRTNTIRNMPGDYPRMRRNEVEDNPEVTCSTGLHVCSYSYLPQYSGGGGEKVVVCKVNPQHVVSVPVDHNDAKMRVCEYLVLKEIDYNIEGDLLAKQPVIDDHLHLRDDDSDCPECGEDIGQDTHCLTCGWEDDGDDFDEGDESDSAPPVVEHPPVIEFLTKNSSGDDDWTELQDHRCSTHAEAEHYVSSLDPEGKSLRIRPNIKQVLDAAGLKYEMASPVAEPVVEWPDQEEDKPVDLRDAVSEIENTANGLFGPDAKVAVHARLDGTGGVEVKMRSTPLDLTGKVKKIIADSLGVDEKDMFLTTTMEEMGADSLDMVALSMAIEEEFSIVVDDETHTNINSITVQSIIDYVDAKRERPI